MMRSVVFSLACSLLLAGGASAQQPGQHSDSTRAMQGPRMNRQMTMQNRQMMMQKMQESDARLDRLVSQMNQSSGGKKVQAMAAVINEMVAQRRQMRGYMREMMQAGGMMEQGGGGRQGMMQNMQPTGSDTALPRSPADDSGHAEHHDTLK